MNRNVHPAGRLGEAIPTESACLLQVVILIGLRLGDFAGGKRVDALFALRAERKVVLGMVGFVGAGTGNFHLFGGEGVEAVGGAPAVKELGVEFL